MTDYNKVIHKFKKKHNNHIVANTSINMFLRIAHGIYT